VQPAGTLRSKRVVPVRRKDFGSKLRCATSPEFESGFNLYLSTAALL
jgi:hypothetical protein